MINYMKSELYRSVKNRNLKIMTVVFLGLLTAMVMVLYYFRMTDTTFRYSNTKFALSNIYTSMTLILILTMVISAIIDDSEYKNHTMKHSVAFGISRNTIYLGRFLVQAIVCVVVYVIITVFLTGISFLFLTHSNADEIGILIRISLGCLSCLLAGLTISYFFIMNSENQMVGATWGTVVIMGVPVICNLVGKKVAIVEKIASIMPYNLISYSGKVTSSNGSDIGAAVSTNVIGVIWVAAFLLIGLMLFQKKEIK